MLLREPVDQMFDDTGKFGGPAEDFVGNYPARWVFRRKIRFTAEIFIAGAHYFFDIDAFIPRK
ncbi:hypothetical protein [Phyllobacterium bourgognense]|uniref:Uncharacterized protein n=1 Tax=Phyllobacterium bourgognense TaxID=314236 RepID=A0A368YVV1_9HYPH|nr:hypothetical protein [Phyllobacterium bourgognense]RCW82324.1 hypothetical protein C7476_108138 [Phyllobacterium bourgognense]